jgi:hypothetical protein
MCLAVAITTAACAVAAPPRIGVFDAGAAGGQGADVQGLVSGLAKEGYAVETFRSLQPLDLLRFDIVYLSDMHNPGNVEEGWRQNIETYVASGGSVLQTWHHHILGQVSCGVQRVYGSRGMHVVPGHSAVAGLDDFDATFEDHIVEKLGPAGTVLIRNDAGQAVAAAGSIGKGKVISTGLALAIPNGRTTRPARGAELRLLKSSIEWLKPDVPAAERLAAALTTPRLEFSPSRIQVAAGFPAVFTVRVGAPTTDSPVVTCDGSTVTAKTTDGLHEVGMLWTYRLEIPTAAREAETRELRIHVQVGDHALEGVARIETIYASPVENERRGVWLHVGGDRRPKDVMPELKRLGLDMAVLRIAGGTAAFYASQVQPDVQDPLASEGGDWLAEAVKYAHANGIEIHPYVNNCIVEGRTSNESLRRLRAGGRLQEGPDGRPIDWFCPSQEINIAAIERPMLEIVSCYDVDGIQYDFIRYPDPQGCFCAKCRARFEQETGKPVADWPKDVVDGERHQEWIEFRCERISAIVKRVSTRIREVNPHVRISAAVFADWPECRASVGQDWARWCREGWLDAVCPMNYTLDPDAFAAKAAAHREAIPPDFPVLQGIGINAGQGTMDDPGHVALHVTLARQAGAAGFLGFCYRPQHTTKLLLPLRDWLR